MNFQTSIINTFINERSAVRHLSGKDILNEGKGIFLKEKIQKIGTALCCIDDESFSLRTHIVQVINADEYGNLYFMLMQPVALYKTEDLKKIPLTLTFYKKAYDYYIQVNAVGKIEEECDNINNYVLVHAKITEAHYVEHQQQNTQQTVIESAKKKMISFSKFLTMFFY